MECSVDDFLCVVVSESRCLEKGQTYKFYGKATNIIIRTKFFKYKNLIALIGFVKSKIQYIGVSIYF